MKIQKDSHTVNRKRAPLAFINAKQPSRFQSFINENQTQSKVRALEELLDQIKQQGERLGSTQTVRDFQLYKKKIHQFVEETVSFGLGIKTSRSLFQPGGEKQVIVQKIDDKLIKMADHLLSQEQDRIKLLSQLGELKGLLINLYS